jgi:hypothetical protein
MCTLASCFKPQTRVRAGYLAICVLGMNDTTERKRKGKETDACIEFVEESRNFWLLVSMR